MKHWNVTQFLLNSPFSFFPHWPFTFPNVANTADWVAAVTLINIIMAHTFRNIVLFIYVNSEYHSLHPLTHSFTVSQLSSCAFSSSANHPLAHCALQQIHLTGWLTRWLPCNYSIESLCCILSPPKQRTSECYNEDGASGFHISSQHCASSAHNKFSN